MIAKLSGWICLLCGISTFMQAKPVHLRCEYLTNPLGIDIEKPSLSWQSDSTEKNWKQSAYQLLVASTPEVLKSAKADIWDSGKQSTGESAGIAYGGPALESRKRYYWSVRVWDDKGRATQSAEQAWWEMGLLRPDDWTAKWIRWQNPEDSGDRADIRWIWLQGQDPTQTVPGAEAVFHLDVSLTEMPQRAALFLIARGDWKVTVNGHDAGAKPHWNEFDRRELAVFLTSGKNSIDITVKAAASDEFRPPGAPAEKTVTAALAALLKITHTDGTIERIPTGDRWQARSSSSAEWSAAAVAGNLGDARFGGDPGQLPQPAALLRSQFAVSKQVKRARVYATALGSYELYLNGQRVSNDILSPGFTQFEKRIQYQTYDVTKLLTSGQNVLGAVLGDGWFASGMTWTGLHFKVLPPVRLLAQLEIEYSDGSRTTVGTDESWKASGSPILHAEIYAGETYDARLEKPGWNKTGFDDSSWVSASSADPYPGKLSAQIDTPPRVVASLKPERVTPMPDGSYVFDMGQNMVGWIALRVNGKAGAAVRLRFAEILNPDGTIYTTNLRNADATDVYTLRGGKPETFRPRFTFHGFRYVEVNGYPGKPALTDLTGEVISSLGGDPTATVTTSNELVNKMWRLGIWGQRSNFLSVPTDCPQRDERLGWMADAAVFWRTGSYNFDIAAFTHKWMRDIVDAQFPNGAFTNIAPNIGFEVEGAPGWGDAGVIVPWTTWIQYGDRSVVEQNWDAMRRWMAFIKEANPDFIRKQKIGPDFSDWLAPDGSTPKDLTDTAYWALIADMMSQMARALGKDDDARLYAEIYSKIRSAFQSAYVHSDGTVGSGSQTGYVLALHMKLLPPEMEKTAVDNLVANIQAHDWHLTTGFLGTPYLLFALANHGRLDAAYHLLLNDTYPSWGYMIKKGATTWWERWNGDTGDPAMNSYNHYAFGSVVAWVYQTVAGIETSSTGPGFHEITIQPHPSAAMTSARGEYQSVYGKIVSEWSGDGSGPFKLDVAIPPNTTAKVILPEIPNSHVTRDGQKLSGSVVEVGSGSYHFDVK
jgi:alpha-L-rhamnosidase